MTTSVWKKTISLFGIIGIVTIQLSPLASMQVFALSGDVEGTTTNQSTEMVTAANLTNIPLLGSGTSSMVASPELGGSVNQILSSSTTEITTTSTTTRMVSSSTDGVPSLDSTLQSSNISTPVILPFISTGTTTLSSILISTSSPTNNEDATGTLPTGTTTITTGTSTSLANILNIVNTNLINSTGSIILANMFDGHSGNIDLRPGTSTESSTCTLTNCNGIDSITTKINADATIANAIALEATSGNNNVTTAEHAVITTGNTIAGLNLVNVANTNLIDSTYFLLSLNSFNTINGDIVLPSLSSFTHNGSVKGPELQEVSLNSSATIANNLDVEAVNSGNSVSNSSWGLIETGEAKSSTNIFNNVNSTLIGGSSISLFLKISGLWAGHLFGLPFGTTFVEDGNNRILEYKNGVLMADHSQGVADIRSTSTAAITNNVKIKANGGNNHTSDTDTSFIKTGDSLASANIINIANSTIIGRNWILAIINIFGDLNGNIAFGKPDLRVKEEVSAESSNIENGTLLTYKISIKNNGDSSISNVVVTSKYDNQHLTITESTVPYVEENGVLKFNISSMDINNTKVITYKAVIKDTQPGTNIINIASARGYESDNNMTDNTDTTIITTSGRPLDRVPFITPVIPTIIPIVVPLINPISLVPQATISSSSLQVERLSASITIIGNNVAGEQVIVIRNLTSQILPAVTLRDVLYDTNGVNKQTETFDLGDILANEEITVSYKLSFGANAQGGKYTLTTVVEEEGQQDLIFNQNGVITYIPYVKKVVTPFSNVSSSTPLSTTSFTTTSPSAITPSYPRNKNKPRIQHKGIVLGAITQSLSPETVYADNGQNATPDTSNMQYSFGSMFLFLLISLMRMYRTHLTGS